MNEEIIIDGVNVSECYADKKKMKDGLYCFWEGGNCEYNKYCYYKQLKRLEQENEELKKFCIELEKQKEKQHNQWFERCTENHNEDSKIIDKYRSALEEIRGKAQHCIRQDVCALCDYSKECAVPDADGLVYDNNRLLIKLINEVLGNEVLA